MSMREPRTAGQSELWFLPARLHRWDHGICLRFNRVSRQHTVCLAFSIASRLGNGIFWYSLMLALLLAFRGSAVPAVLHMVATGLICTLLYKGLKRTMLRRRPYEMDSNIICAVPPLDRFSFPSGHTQHAVAFSMIAIAYYPWLTLLLLPFSLLIALSRVALGLHYPSDVMAGAAIGALLAAASLAIT